MEEKNAGITERIVRIETKLDVVVETIRQVSTLQIAIARNEEAIRNAHDRINNIYKVAGMISGVVAVVVSIISAAWKGQ